MAELQRMECVKILTALRRAATYHLSKDQMRYAHEGADIISRSRLTKDLIEAELIMEKAFNLTSKEPPILRSEPGFAHETVIDDGDPPAGLLEEKTDSKKKEK